MSARVRAVIPGQFDTSSPVTLKRDLARLARDVEDQFRRLPDPDEAAPIVYDVTSSRFGAEAGARNATPGILKALHTARDTTSGTGVLYLPPGRFQLATPDTQDEGAAIRIPTGYDHFTIRGAGPGATILEPISNTMEMVLQMGGASLTVENLSFDNRRYGVLQGQVKRGPDSALRMPGGGVATLGNQANCAIRQAKGANLTVRNCWFYAFTSGIHYIGDYTDEENVTDGICFIGDCRFYGCAFGVLIEQPEFFYMVDCSGFDTIGSELSTGNIDKGHTLYVAYGVGATPDLIYTRNVGEQNGHSNGQKIRKGAQVIVADPWTRGNGRGVSLLDVDGSVVANMNIHLGGDYAADGQRSCLSLINCGNTRVLGGLLNTGDASAYGVRMTDTDPDDDEGEPANEYNNGNYLHGLTTIGDYSGGVGKAPYLANGQTDGEFDSCIFLHAGTTAGNRWPFDLRSCVRFTVKDPEHKVPDYSAPNPTDAHRLVSVDADCVDTILLWSDTGIRVALAADTIDDEGTDTVSLNNSKTASVWRDRIDHGWGILTSETVTLINAMAVNPPRLLTFAIDDFIAALKASGWWDEIGYMIVPVLHTEQASLLDWKNPTQSATNVGAAFTAASLDTGSPAAAGLLGDGVGDYVNTIGPEDVTGYALDTAHQFVWVEDGTDTTFAVGVASGALRMGINPHNGTNLIVRNNPDGATNLTIGAVGARNGLFHTRRVDNANVTGYRNGASVATQASASGQTQGAVSTLLRHESTYTDDRILIYGIGGLSVADPADLHTAAEAFFDAIGVTYT